MNNEITLEDLAKRAAKEFILANDGPFDMARVKAEKNEEMEALFLQLLKKGLNFSDAEYTFSERERTKYWNNKREKISFEDVVFEKNMTLILLLPKMIFSYKALDELEKSKDLSRLCAMMLMKMHKNNLPTELELAVVHLPGNGNLVQAFIDVGYRWSDRAKRQIERFYPDIHKNSEYRDLGSWMFC